MSEFSFQMLDNIGQELVDDGLVSPDQLAVAMETKKNLGGDLGHILIRKGFVNEDQILEFLSRRLNIPFISLEEYTIDPEVVKLVPASLAQKYHFMPLFRIEDSITVAMSDPLDVFGIDEIRNAIKYRIQPVLASAQEIEKLIREHYRAAEMAEEASSSGEVEIMHFGAETAEAASDKLAEMASGAKVISEVNRIINSAVNEAASDIHIEPSEKSMRIRNRVDGVLEEWLTMPKQMHLPVITRIKIISGMDIAERRIPQDGRVRIRVSGRVVDMRVSTYPTMYGEKVVIRLLGHEKIYGLEDLGMPENDRSTFEKIIKRPHGIFLVTGPTGSGKTTTLYAALSRINSQDRNIVSIEDPIENQIPGISQAQINPRAGLTFATALRSILRQDPDVIMVGEIRDRDTADIAVRSAITGHLVFSTLHTNTATGAITRMKDLGVEPFLVSSALLGVMAQRLIRRVCSDCKEPHEETDAIRKALGIAKDVVLYRGKGCRSCRMSGYSGRMGIFELLEVSPKMRRLISEGGDEVALRDEAAGQGMSSLVQAAIDRAVAGETTVSEVVRVTGEEEDEG